MSSLLYFSYQTVGPNMWTKKEVKTLIRQIEANKKKIQEVADFAKITTGHSEFDQNTRIYHLSPKDPFIHEGDVRRKRAFVVFKQHWLF